MKVMCFKTMARADCVARATVLTGLSIMLLGLASCAGGPDKDAIFKAVPPAQQPCPAEQPDCTAVGQDQSA